MISILFTRIFSRMSFQQTLNWWRGKALQTSISFLTKGFQYLLSLPISSIRRNRLHFWEHDVHARPWITAGEMHWWPACLVSAHDVSVHDVGNHQRRYLVMAFFSEAVVLVDDYRVLNCVHSNVVEGHLRHRTRPSLPCFDPNTIIWVLYDWVTDCDVWNTVARFIPSKTSNAAQMPMKCLRTSHMNLYIYIT